MNTVVMVRTLAALAVEVVVGAAGLDDGTILVHRCAQLYQCLPIPHMTSSRLVNHRTKGEKKDLPTD